MILVEPHVARGATVGLDAHAHRQTSGRPRNPNRGLAIGPMAQVSQIQLVQPVLSIAWAGLLLAEHIAVSTIIGGLVVIACAASAVRVRLKAPQ